MVRIFNVGDHVMCVGFPSWLRGDVGIVKLKCYYKGFYIVDFNNHADRMVHYTDIKKTASSGLIAAARKRQRHG